MSYATLDDLRSQLGGYRAEDDPVYRAKQIHELPKIQIQKREEFILKHCKDKRVLEFGASGNLTKAIKDIAREYLGVDRTAGERIIGFDLDDVSQPLPERTTWRPEIIVCGEVLEHLGNPLHFLKRLKQQYAGVPVIITVPNAYAAVSQVCIKKGYENVNKDHVAWYSPKTLATLLSRAGYTYADLFYYNGKDATAEGLIVVTE